MFFNCFNSYAISVREKFTQIQKVLGFITILFALSSLAYFMFYIGAAASEYVLEAGKSVFEPLAKFLNMQNTSVEIYRNTSIILFCSIFPTIFVQYLLSRTEEAILSADSVKEAKKQQKEELDRYNNYMSRYDVIQSYSICLSIDWTSEKEVSNKNKELLNRGVFMKLSETLKKVDSSANMQSGFVFVFSSNDFSKYDMVYETILSQLSKTKRLIESRYGFKLMPSMTTDAGSEKNYTAIQNEHFEIQSFNFKNRAIVSGVFSDKYKHLKHKKYAGIPIGEYAYFGGGKTKTFELNVVHKDLTKILGSSS